MADPRRRKVPVPSLLRKLPVRHRDIMHSINLHPDVANNGYITLCNFGGHRLSGFKVIEGDSEAFPRPPITGS